jgi:hypothetical protein
MSLSQQSVCLYVFLTDSLILSQKVLRKFVKMLRIQSDLSIRHVWHAVWHMLVKRFVEIKVEWKLCELK